MKKYFTTVILFFLISPLWAQPIKFISDAKSWDGVLLEAKQQNKRIFVDVYTTWCGPCKAMDMEVFSQKDVGAYYNENFINVKIDAEKNWGMSFSKTHQITSYPTYLFFKNDGKLILTALGFMQAERFLAIGKTAKAKLTGDSKNTDYNKIFLSGNYDKDFLYGYINATGAIDQDRSLLLELYLSRLTPDSLTSDSATTLIHRYGNTNKLDSYVVKALLKQYEKYPVKSGLINGPWRMLVNKINAGIEDAAKSNNVEAMNRLINFNEKLETSDYAKQRESDYLKCGYYIYSGDQKAFNKSLSNFYQQSIKEVDAAVLYNLDSTGFSNAYSFELIKNSKNQIDNFKKTFYSESFRTISGFLGLIRMYEREGNLKDKELNNQLKLWIPEVVKLYKSNPVYINSYIVDSLNEFKDKL